MNPGHAPEVLPVAGKGWTAWNALRAAGFRAIGPLAGRAQVMHFVDDALERVTEDRRSDRTEDRGSLRGAERAVRWLVEAHAGAAQTMRQSAMTNCRIIMRVQSAVCNAGNRACRGASSLNPKSGRSIV